MPYLPFIAHHPSPQLYLQGVVSGCWGARHVLTVGTRGEEGMARSCPLCRSERAYADTTPIKGMDEFLRAIVPLLGCNDNTGHGDPSDDDDGMPCHYTPWPVTGSSYQLLHHLSTQLF